MALVPPIAARRISSRPRAALMLTAVAIASSVAAQSPVGGASSWPQWGGPNRNFIADAANLADSWPEGGPRTLWSRPLGLGHSAIAVDEGRLYTLYRTGQDAGGRPRTFDDSEAVIALDAATGATVWEHRYAAPPLNFSYGAGPHSTPLVAGARLFTTGTNKQLHAFDKATGAVLWSHDLVKEFGAPPTLIRPAVKAGYAVSPIAYGENLIVQVGGRGQAVMAFRQRDGAVAWKSGDFLVAESSPILITVDGQTQLVVLGGQTVNGLDPDTGALLWSHSHDTDGDMNNAMPIWGPDNTLVVSSGYNQGTRALKLSRGDGRTKVDELWFTNRMKLMFANGLRVGDMFYGTHGDFGPAFLTALDVKTGAVAWQQRGFGRSSLLYADGKVILLDEDGDLVLGRLTPSGMTVLSQAHIFDTVSWTVPSLVGRTLYARDRARAVALDLGAR